MTDKDDKTLADSVDAPGRERSPSKPKGPGGKTPPKREPRVRSGIHEQLEAEADALIFGSLKDVTSREEKSDILTPWKEKNRKSREILSRSGHPIDGALRRGMFHRTYNPVQTHLNSYDGPTRPVKLDSNWDDEHGGDSSYVSPQMKQVFGTERED
jgi:hypothetical protein